MVSFGLTSSKRLPPCGNETTKRCLLQHPGGPCPSTHLQNNFLTPATAKASSAEVLPRRDCPGPLPGVRCSVLILIPIMIPTEAQTALGPCGHWWPMGAGVCAWPALGGMQMTAYGYDFNLCCQVNGGDPCRDPEEESICLFWAKCSLCGSIVDGRGFNLLMMLLLLLQSRSPCGRLPEFELVRLNPAKPVIMSTLCNFVALARAVGMPALSV